MEIKTKAQTGKATIDILAEMTRRDVARNLQIENTKNVNAEYSPRNGWHLKHDSDVIKTSKVWQDNK